MTAAAKLTTVAGVDIGKIARQILKNAYEKTFSREATADISKLVEELAGHFQSISAGKEIMECENCGGGSPSALFPEFCPFCGESDDEDASASPEPTGVFTAGLTAAAANGVSGAHAEASPVEVENVIPIAPASNPKASKAKKARALVVAPPAKLAPVPVSVVELSVSTEQDLDAALARLKKARDAGASALWTLSVELRGIYDGDLWKLRNGEDGEPKYKAFSKFLAEEVELHERTVYRMIEVTREFKPAEAQKYGVSLLRGLLAAPKEDRAEILEKVGKGVVKGTRGVAREVEKIRKRKGVEVVETGAKDGTGKHGAKAAAKASAKKAAVKKETSKKVVTIAVPSGRKAVKLLARKLKKTDPEKFAKKVEDRPWGKLECANGAALFFTLIENATGCLELSIEARRDD